MKLLPVQAGLAVVVATHLWMLNSVMPQSMVKNHALINLGAAAAIAYGVFFLS